MALLPFQLLADEVERGSARSRLEETHLALEHQKIDRVFRRLDQIQLKQLAEPAFFKQHFPSAQAQLLHAPYWTASSLELSQRVIGPIRLYDLLRSEISFQDRHFKPILRSQYLFRLDPALVHKLLDLFYALYRSGYDPTRIRFNSSYRSPLHNDYILGARQSRHMHGEAADLSIGDINHDGRTDRHDKQIVLGLLESKLLRGKGGIGKYPGTQVVHLDVRPWMARWDGYKR